MPRANPFDQELIGSLKETEIKKESETTTTSITDPDVEVAQGRLGRFRLTGFVLLASAATVVSLEDETTVLAVIPLEAKVALPIVLPEQGYLSTTPGNELKLKTLNTAKLTGSFWGAENE